jgi:hypothetical protein
VKLRPLKNVGFQINSGAIPHFKNIEKIIKNQDIPIKNKLFKLETLVK